MKGIRSYKIKILTGLFLLAMLGPLSSCKEELDEDLAVLSERVLLAGSDKIRFAGRILSLSDVDLDDHGFEVSQDDQFTAPQILSLGEKKANGGFIGEVGGLLAGANYWWRSFIVVDGDYLYGESLTVSTLEEGLIDFQPRVAAENSTVTLRGRNFPEEATIFFGDQEATILEQSDYEIRVRVPAISTNYLVSIRIETVNGTLTFAQPFEYVIGVWQALDPFPIIGRAVGGITLKSGTEVLYGLGAINSAKNGNTWVSDLDNINWSVLSFPGPELEEAFSAGKYFGSGIIERSFFPGIPLTLDDKLWSYENGIFTEEATTPFRLYGAVALETGTDLYVMGGYFSNNSPNEEIYKYSISGNSWTYVDDLPLTPIDAQNPSFYYDGNIYIVDDNGLMFRYQISAGIWEVINSFPDADSDDLESVQMGDKVFMGLAGGRRTLYEYSIVNNTWKSKISIPINKSIESYAAWSNNGKLYFLLNTELQQNNQIDLWELNPDAF